MPRKPPADGRETLESRLKKLEGILEQLGEGEANIDQATELYEEGMQLVKDCRRELRDTRGRVVKLNRETGKLEPL